MGGRAASGGSDQGTQLVDGQVATERRHCDTRADEQFAGASFHEPMIPGVPEEGAHGGHVVRL